MGTRKGNGPESDSGREEQEPVQPNTSLLKILVSSSLSTGFSGAGGRLTYYPRFRCELSFIERLWCVAKRYIFKTLVG